jgi:hypothetical protein
MAKIAVTTFTLLMELIPIMSNRILENATVVIDVKSKILMVVTTASHWTKTINTSVLTLAKTDTT